MSRILAVAIVAAAAGLLTACPHSSQPSSATSSTAAPGPSPAAARRDEAAAPAPATTPPGANAKRAAGQENAPVLAWRALGTEPFWNVRVDGDTLVFSTPEGQDGRTMHGRRVPSLVGFVYLGKDGAMDFHLDIQPGECSDGMSDNRYEYVATFTYADTTYKGCGEAAK